jgi:hypothetical protein
MKRAFQTFINRLYEMGDVDSAKQIVQIFNFGGLAHRLPADFRKKLDEMGITY